MLHADAIVAPLPALCARPEERQIDPLVRLQMAERDVGNVKAEPRLTCRHIGNLQPAGDSTETRPKNAYVYFLIYAGNPVQTYPAGTPS